MGTEAQKYVWEGAIPLQIRLHESEITTHPPPPPALILGPRLGYLPLLKNVLKPYFIDTLPPGAETIWFEYKGLPLKWYIPIGALFDLLCVEPERPWNLSVHFRGYPGDLLSPCEGEDSVKWSFINSLKEAAYIINGNCKNVMNMSQSDQVELWQSLVKVKMEGYLRISSKLKLGALVDECAYTLTSCSTQPQETTGETQGSGPSRTGRIPVRLYLRNVRKDYDDLEDETAIDSWDSISYINRPVEIHNDDGKIFTLHDALKVLLPEFFEAEPSIDERSLTENKKSRTTETTSPLQDSVPKEPLDERHLGSSHSSRRPEIILVRIQGIEPKFDIPFAWVAKNLMHPDHFLHISVFVRFPVDR